MLTSVLEQWGYQVRTAANGREAITELERKPADLVLLDAVMPEMDGAAFLQQRRQREVLSAVPTVVISGFPDYAIASTMGLGAEGFLSKPFGLEELMRTLQRMTAPRSP
jgi:CheY-like chemotaxis protein